MIVALDQSFMDGIWGLVEPQHLEKKKPFATVTEVCVGEDGPAASTERAVAPGCC